MSRGHARQGFDQDLLFGQAREDAFMRTLLGGAYIEHKADERARETGNLYVEFETSSLADGFGVKRPSGIAVTEATRWAHEFDEDCWLLLPTTRVLQLVSVSFQVWGGDDNRFHGALVRWAHILRPPKTKPDNGQLEL